MDKKPPYVCHVNEQIEGAVYIGRANGRRRLKRSKWANPYKIGDKVETVVTDLDTGTESKDVAVMTRTDVIREYRDYLDWEEALLIDDIDELSGKPLACWCRRSDEERTEANMCHGDVLVELWKEAHDVKPPSS